MSASAAMNIRRLLAGLLLGPLASAAVAALTLDQALIAAYQTNPTLGAQRQALRAVGEGVPQAQAGWRPSVTLTGRAGRLLEYRDGTPSHAPEIAGKDSGRYDLSLVQPLYSGGRTTAQRAQASDLVMLMQAQLAGTEQQVLLDTATAFYSVLQAKAALNLTAAHEQALTALLQSSRRNLEQHEVTQADVRQAEARTAQASVQRILAETELEATQAQFVNLTGLMADVLTATTQALPLQESLTQAVEVALAKNPNLLAADWAARAATDGVDAAAAERLPKLVFEAGYGNEQPLWLAGNREASARAALVLTVPIYDAVLAASRTRAQKDVQAQRALQREQARRDVVQQVTLAWQGLVAAKARLQLLDQQARANAVALQGIVSQAVGKARSVLDLLNAHSEGLAADISHSEAERDAAVFALRLRAAIGGLSAQALALAAEIIDPVTPPDTVLNSQLASPNDTGESK